MVYRRQPVVAAKAMISHHEDQPREVNVPSGNLETAPVSAQVRADGYVLLT
jgi:hypothetical protein